MTAAPNDVPKARPIGGKIRMPMEGFDAMMAAVFVTSRVARQTSRWVRFATVTVQVDRGATDEVIVAPGIFRDETLRHEAVCGAHEALGHVPTGRRHRLTVVDALTTEVDTGIGDVYEATARAARQALSLDPSMFSGFSDPRMVASWLQDRVGCRLVEVTEARYRNNGERDPDTATSLLHAWLGFDHRPPTQLHGCGDDLELSIADPYPGYDMEFGEVRVAAAAGPGLLAEMVGRRLTDAAVVLGPLDRPACAGLLLRLDEVTVAVGTLGDEWILAADELPAQLTPYWRVQPWIIGARTP